MIHEDFLTAKESIGGLATSQLMCNREDRRHETASKLRKTVRTFENQRVLVTGSGRGIGQGIARRFAEGGARVMLVARSQRELDETRADLLKLTADVRAVPLGLTLPTAARRILDETADAWGGLDILLTNAGAALQGGFLELDDGAWPDGFGLKVFSKLRVIKHA